jgi:predicted protein tyrosine phosphatase
MSNVNSRLYVCPLQHVEKTVAETGAECLVSVLDAADIPPTPQSIAPHCHFKIATDVELPCNLKTLNPETLRPLQNLVAFARAWSQSAPIVVHCKAGLSRSTAAAFAILCALNETTIEEAIAQTMRHNSAQADPDALITAFADKVLVRDGRMRRAIANMSEAMPAETGTPFSMPTRIQFSPNSGKTSQKAA